MLHGTASGIEVDQFREFAGAVIRQLPACMSSKDAQYWIGHQSKLKQVLSDVLLRDAYICINVSSTISFDQDMTKEGWTLKSDAEVVDGEITLELVDFLQQGESSISGDQMIKRAKEMNVSFGQRHAEALLRDQANIPEEWRKYVLVFPGTVWRDPDGLLRVPYLYWLGDHWYLLFRWLEGDFYSNYRFVHSRNCLHFKTNPVS